MNRQEAYEYLKDYLDNVFHNSNDYETYCYLRDCADTLAPPDPDPITGLMPCGCGGKAEFYEPDDEFYMVGVECSQCYVSTCATCDKEHATHDWNRAMGCY